MKILLKNDDDKAKKKQSLIQLIRPFARWSRHYWLVAGNYSRMALEIQFVRNIGYYMIQIYIPSGLIVVISWVSFWLDRAATPARVSLGVTAVLTMATLMSSTNATLPKISYIKSIDIYLGACFVLIFASLLGKSLSFLSLWLLK